jgi:segregation and condensation protein A
MAANLMYIKSRELLPKDVQPPEEDAEENDPRWELIRQLVEYKKFKEAAQFLGVQEVKGDELFVTTPELPDLDAPVETLGQVGIFDLIRAFQRILKRFENASDFREIVNDRYTVADKIEHLLEIVAVGSKVRFEDLFTSAASRGEVIVTFLAMLELIKLNHLQVEQEQLLGDIVVVRPAV